ncbi:hypothetical protein OGATHE_006550 [Ogataea polymorpha]|uniref:Uncharacterized protein n=1 Tax=Ogataea polymorpha TaxID=460523 RepID=A0A9P8NSX0_9ASCO|nr:hypothetical protein OGATHE_006550 [Ogataea polymorpha]
MFSAANDFLIGLGNNSCANLASLSSKVAALVYGERGGEGIVLEAISDDPVVEMDVVVSVFFTKSISEISVISFSLLLALCSLRTGSIEFGVRHPSTCLVEPTLAKW